MFGVVGWDSFHWQGVLPKLPRCVNVIIYIAKGLHQQLFGEETNNKKSNNHDKNINDLLDPQPLRPQMSDFAEFDALEYATCIGTNGVDLASHNHSEIF